MVQSVSSTPRQLADTEADVWYTIQSQLKIGTVFLKFASAAPDPGVFDHYLNSKESNGNVGTFKHEDGEHIWVWSDHIGQIGYSKGE